ncbi:MAG TPA: acyl-CoA dehydratase activase [Syntrophomonadaceae bacterium]|nr:acyl-CoA dehydratase activase [Syntrophomonadaceae bacterium]
MYVLGIDIGSASSKVVIIDNTQTIIANAVESGGAGTTGPARVLDEVFKKSGLGWENISRIVATGYGRIGFQYADNQISEITCHAIGVRHLVPTVQTIIDIGGQDVKAMSISKEGFVSKFVMNDKCAAGTGRFLEVMARVLETDVSKLGELAEQANSVIDVSNTCTVFAESEVISRLASGVRSSDIAAGIHRSVARRVAGLAARVGIRPTVVLTGGVAQNQGIVEALSDGLKQPIMVSPNCQITGALGAALIALKEMMISSQRVR